MNKQMREILAKIDAKTKTAETMIDEGKRVEAKALLDEIKALREDYAVAEELYTQQMAAAAAAVEGNSGNPAGKGGGWSIMAKILRKEKVTEAEAALITGDVANNSENYLVPEDVDFTIRELRKQYKSAKELVTVIPTTTMSGGFNFEADDSTELSDLTDGDDLTTADNPTFVRKAWAIALKGALILVSNILKGVEKAGLMVYLDRWFVKKAVRTENTSIFTALKADKVAKPLRGWNALKRSMIKDLDPAALIGGVIVTNQSGFNILDEARDENGRPILQPNPADATKKLFQGLAIHVFADRELANESGAAPVFYGNLKSGCYFIDLLGLQFGVSEHYAFAKNATAMRVIEGYDVLQGDSGAYLYGLLTPEMGNGRLEVLDVLSVEGSASGKTLLSAFPGCPAGYTAKYKTAATVAAPAYDDVITSGYTNLTTGDTTATTGHDVVIVYLDADNKVKAAGKTTVASKA